MKAAQSATHYDVLGPLRVTRAGETLEISSRMQRKILVALLIAQGGVVTPDRLEHVLWGDDPPKTSRKTLHTLISRLRGVLGSDAIVTHPEGYSMAAATDVSRFERLVDEARALMTERPEQSVAKFDEALALWRGAALVAFRDEEFAAVEARRLDELKLVAEEERFEALIASGRHETVIGPLEAFVSHHPYRERPHAQLMIALYRAGRAPEALAVYAAYRMRAIEELGLDPSPELQALEVRMLRQDPALGPGRDHLELLEAPHVAPLPAAPNRLVGRERDLAALREAVDGSRIVTVVGPPGVGKTRLAMEVGRVSGPRPADGVRWVELAETDGCCSVGETVMAELGLRHRAGRPISDQLGDALVGRDLLLILDNCEHVVAEAADLVDALVRRSASVRVLATSREPLGIGGERIFPVEPLEVAGHNGGGVSPALELFVERAQAVRPDFALDDTNLAVVEAICRRLDGLPLAIELVAPELRTFSPAEIEDRLQQHMIGIRPRAGTERHRTLDAAIGWSYSALDDDAQVLFERLSVFAGGFDLRSAGAVVTDDMRDRVPELLQSLVEGSLVSADRSRPSTRYFLLETLRGFGQQRLFESGRLDEVATAHTSWAVDLVEDLHRAILGPDEAEAVARLDMELPNVRAAHAHALRTGDVDSAIRLAAGLHPYAFYRLRDEVTSWSEASIRLPGAEGHRLFPAAAGAVACGLSLRWDLDEAEAVALLGIEAAVDESTALYPMDALAVVALERGDLAEARSHARRLHGMATEADDQHYVAFALLTEFVAALYMDEDGAAKNAVDQLIEIADRSRNPSTMGWVMNARAEYLQHTDPDRALQLTDEALELAGSVGNDLLVGLALRTVADIHAANGDRGPAVRAFSRIITHWHVRGDWAHQLGSLRRLVVLLTRLERFADTAVLLGAVKGGYEGAQLPDTAQDELDDAAAEIRRMLGDDEFEHADRRGRRMNRFETVAFARGVLEELGSSRHGRNAAGVSIANEAHRPVAEPRRR